jgi:hypothetical protein
MQPPTPLPQTPVNGQLLLMLSLLLLLLGLTL